MMRVGLTGSIAMGKSTVAAMFAARGAPVYDADGAVHRLYAAGGPAVEPVRAIAPEAVTSAGVDRAALKQRIEKDPSFLDLLNTVVHPLVGADRAEFDRRAEASGASYALYDIPLLFETGGETRLDLVIVVSAGPEIQRERALARGVLTPAQFEMILSRQTPDAVKRERADIIIETGVPLSDTETQVDAIHRRLLAMASRHARS